LIGLVDRSIHSVKKINNNIIVGTDSGIFVSSNNGLNWNSKNEGLDRVSEVKSICVFNNELFIGTIYSICRRNLYEVISIHNISIETPSSYLLGQNYPNPFNPSTNIRYQIANAGYVTLKVFDILGKEIAVLVNKNQKPGTYEVTFDGESYPSGIYFYRLEAGDFSETRKMILVK